MSGTSMDGIDLAMIESDGQNTINSKKFSYLVYESDFKNRLKSLIYNNPSLSEIKLVENELTLLHAKLVNDFLIKNNINRKEIDLIAFHGHTILHDPSHKITWQIGNATLLANQTQIKVVADFRIHDVINGGQGAPLVPIYHFYLFKNFYSDNSPIAVLNIGGISNLTYFFCDDENSIKASDICFGNAPLDDLMKERLQKDFDEDGKIAESGTVNLKIAEYILSNKIFYHEQPKSFDRNDFNEIILPIKNLPIADALATLAYIEAQAIAIHLNFFKIKPKEIFICGGGRKNFAIITEIKKALIGIQIRTTEEIGLNGDAIEAEAFAFLGIRSLINLPISFPNTTGILQSACGGTIYKRDK